MPSSDQLNTLFSAPFNNERWTTFLHAFFGASTLHKSPKQLGGKDGDEGYLLGEFTTADGYKVGLFRFDITQGSILRRKSGLRALADHFLRTRGFDSAIAVFVQNGVPEWRFSYICDIKDAATHPRRFTYVFGVSARSYRTPVERFQKLQSAGISHQNILAAFAVEALTKEFYAELFNWYEHATGDTKKKVLAKVRFPDDIIKDGSRRNAEMTIRLISRLLFCWFLKQKNIIPDSLFDKTFADKWLNYTDASGSTYYKAILQNLFFATLNLDPKETKREFANYKGCKGVECYRYKRFFKPEMAEQFVATCASIPFLNGGLFECLDKDRESDTPKRLDCFSNLSSNESRLVVPDALFFDSDVGIFPLLNRYNFTVEENTPLDQEIALDPELLGKVFENLLASYNPETGESARKKTGSFYTPREIVDYMTATALAATLGEEEKISREDTKTQSNPQSHSPENLCAFAPSREKIFQLKILDPACGSGAFPMGILNHILERLNPPPAERYATKLHIIENCIYGVDIQPIAVQIAKLRFFISLVCDWPDGETPPLPNLENNFVCANTLIGKRKQAATTLFDNIEVETLKEELRKTRHEHFSARHTSEKKKLRKQDAELRSRLYHLLSENDLFAPDDARQLAQWDPYDQNATSHFFDPEWMFGINDGFDIVIGNPPYFNVDTLGANSPMMKYLKENYTLVWQDKSDILFYFINKALTLSANTVSFIVSNAFLFSDKAKKLRNFILQDGRLSRIVNFERLMIFDEALITTCVLVFSKIHIPKSTVQAVTLKEEKYDSKSFSDFITDDANYFSAELQENSVFALVDDKTAAINQKIDANHPKLQDIVVIGQGMQTGANSVYSFEKQPLQIPKECLRHHIDGSSIRRYSISGEMEWLLYIEDVENFADLPKTVQQHLEAHKETLSNRADKKRRATAKWWNYTFSLHREKYHLPKLWCSYRGKQNAFALDESGEYIGLTNTTVIFDTNPSYSLKYLLALLNSQLLTFRYRSIGKQTGGGIFEFFANGIGKLPIPSITPEKQAPIIALVDRILTAKRANPVADTAALESEIDTLVYSLYGLNTNEISIVEGK